MSRREAEPVAYDFEDAGHEFLIINVGAVDPSLQGQYRLVLIDTQEQVGEFAISLDIPADGHIVTEHAREYLRAERADIDVEHKVRVGNRLGLIISHVTKDDEFLVEFHDREVKRFPRHQIIPNAFTEPQPA
ncbi:hypothetical protein GCM10025867_50710 (plasmid) [Frondihabitans sucicola]|uniref:Uncharacterized protein n=1 Tax=Frondihabitans sucicola TaxID=1268041 RepID=A0ABN6YA84_9MICO|nr:hypothetical protein [Frondihabitans sucicola]BDZ52830.1 hypothetical protein GCM10025867_50710 [Frondihabitans sucicola]